MLPVVIPAAPGSPHLATCIASLPDDCVVYVVSEEPQAGTHVPVASRDGFAARANTGLGAAQADGHAAARERDDDRVREVQRHERRREPTSGVESVAERSPPSPPRRPRLV